MVFLNNTALHRTLSHRLLHHTAPPHQHYLAPAAAPAPGKHNFFADQLPFVL